MRGVGEESAGGYLAVLVEKEGDGGGEQSIEGGVLDQYFQIGN